MKPNIRTTCFAFSLLFSAGSWAGSYGKTSLTNATEASYMIGVTALGIPSSAAELFELSGSSSKVVRIQEITVDTWNTAGGYISWSYFSVSRRSTATTGGTATSVTPAKLDTNNSASTVGTSKYFTGGPTAGTLVDVILRSLVYAYSNPTDLSTRTLFKADTPAQAITLRGTGDYITIGTGANVYNNGAYGTYNLNIKFTESSN